jgi:hypothetical protein
MACMETEKNKMVCHQYGADHSVPDRQFLAGLCRGDGIFGTMFAAKMLETSGKGKKEKGKKIKRGKRKK